MDDGAAGAAATYREGATPLGGLAELYREQQHQPSASPLTVFIVATEDQAKQLRAFIVSVENTLGLLDVDPTASTVLVATEDQARDFASEIVRQNQIRVSEGLPEVQVLDIRECAVMRKRVTC
jgi:hypothetical protein